MKMKHFVGLLIVCLLVGTAGYLVRRDYRHSWQPAGELGQKLFADLDVNAVARITIRGSGGSVELARANERWVVTDLFKYPADFQKLAEFVRLLPELKVIQPFAVAKTDYHRLEVEDPADQHAKKPGLAVDLADKDGKVMAQLVIGLEHRDKGREDSPYGGNFPNGRYLRLPKTGAVVLVKETFASVRPDAKNWLDTTFPRVSNLVRAAVSREGQEAWSVSKDPKGAALVLNGAIPDGKTMDSDKLDRVKNVLAWANFNTIGDPKTPDTEWGFGDATFVAQSDDGFTYTFRLGKATKDNNLPVRLTVAYQAPELKAGPENEKPEDKAKREQEQLKTVQENTDKASREKSLFEGWVYLLPTATSEPMQFKRDDFLKAAEPPKTEDKKPAGTEAKPPEPGAPETEKKPAPGVGDEPDPEAMIAPEAKQVPPAKLVPVPAPKPVPGAKPAPAPAAKPTPVPGAKPTPAPAAKPTPAPAAKPAPAPAAKPAPTPEAKPAPAPAAPDPAQP